MYLKGKVTSIVLVLERAYYLANTNAHGKRSTTFIAAIKNYPIIKSCSIMNLCKQATQKVRNNIFLLPLMSLLFQHKLT